jgi:hypothetical protein
MKLLLAAAAASLPAAALASQVFGFAIESAAGRNDRLAPVEVGADGLVKYHSSIEAPPSDAFCNVAFTARSRGGAYFVPAYTLDRSGRQSILTINATSGAVLRNVTTSEAITIPAMAYDDVNGVLYAAGLKTGVRGATVYSIDPATGDTKEIGSVDGIPDIQLCEAAFSPPTAAQPLGSLIFLYDPLNVSAADAYVVFDVKAGKTVNAVIHDGGGLNSITAWAPPGGSGYELLSMSYLDSRPMELISIQPDSGASKVILTLPVEGYVPAQGAQAFDEDTGTIWVALGYNDPKNSSFYPVLLEIDATKTPATFTQHWLDETKAKAGIWSLWWSSA